MRVARRTIPQRAQPGKPRARPARAGLRLQARRDLLPWWGALNVLPVPGLGAAWIGWRNPHTRLLRNGVVQATLVVLGSYPLLVPGAIGLAWAVVDGVRIARATPVPLPPKPPKAPEPVDDPGSPPG